MKLEIKHLAPYLPYGLKYYLDLNSERIGDYISEDPWKFTHDIHTAIDSGFESALAYKNMYVYQKQPFLAYEDNELFLGQMVSSLGFDVDDVYLSEVKPILRPLSDITKKIGDDDNNLTYSAYLKLWTKADLEYCQSNPLGMCYETISQLFQWHFDVFGLIEKGLAINLNDIK